MPEAAMKEQQKYKLERTGDRQISVIICGIVIPIANDTSWQLGGVVSNNVLDLNGEGFEIFRNVHIEHNLVIKGFIKVCHGYNNDPGRFPCERISYDEFVELTKFGLLTSSEVAEYMRFLDRQEKIAEKDSRETIALTKIYLIRDNATRLVKIGQSQNPERRLKALIDQATLMPLPNDFELIHSWEAPGYKEHQLHEKFLDKRVRGEWFQLTQADVEEIIELTKR